MNIRGGLVTAGGLGLMPIAPGTWGSLPPVALAFGMAALAVPVWMMDVSLILLAVAFSIACVRFGEYAEQRFGRKDPSQVVADEVAGQSLALLMLPWRQPTTSADWMWNIGLAMMAFAFFRIFDVTKVPPASQAQRLRGGWGILVDDLIAGIYALIATHMTAYFVLPMFV